MSRLSPIGLNSILSYIKSWVIGKIPTKNSELTNDSGYITTSSVPTNYVTSDTDQVVSGVKTTSNYKYIVGPDMTKGTTPTSNRYVTIHRYYDKNMNAVGEYWLRQTATGNTELNFSAKDAFTNGARATTGTDISSYLSIGVNSSGKSYWEVNGGCRNNLLPLSSNNYDLGSSTLQWNKVYSKEYYINGTIMGDIVTHNNSEYAKSSHTHTKANITDFPAFGTTAGTICQGNDSRLSNARTPTSHTHTKSQITDFPSLATVATSGSYTDLSNKPTIPTVNNATLTIQKNSSNVATFTANASSNVTANITVPTKVSQLTNDSGFITGIAWGSVTGKPSTFTPSSHTHTKSQITDFPSLATVATSGSYNDLTDRSVLTVNGATSLGWSGIGGVANGSTLQLRTTDNTSPSICFHRSGHSHVVLAEAGGALGIQAQGSNWLELATKSWVTNQGYITTNGAAYPRRVGGVTMNFNWSGQGGQPTWLWGGEDGTNMYVYNPANFSVNYANSAGSVAWSNVTGKPTIPTNTNQLTNGAGFITSSGSCNYANSAGSAGSCSSISFSNNGQCYINAGGADCADAIDSQACNLAIRAWWSIGFYDQCFSKYAISMNTRDGVVRAYTLRAENSSDKGLQLGSYHVYVG